MSAPARRTDTGIRPSPPAGFGTDRVTATGTGTGTIPSSAGLPVATGGPINVYSQAADTPSRRAGEAAARRLRMATAKPSPLALAASGDAAGPITAGLTPRATDASLSAAAAPVRLSSEPTTTTTTAAAAPLAAQGPAPLSLAAPLPSAAATTRPQAAKRMAMTPVGTSTGTGKSLRKRAAAGASARGSATPTAAKSQAGPTTCAVCLADFERGENLAQLPCSPLHVFHSDCLLPWLRVQKRCPLCTLDIDEPPTPSASTSAAGRGGGAAVS